MNKRDRRQKSDGCVWVIPVGFCVFVLLMFSYDSNLCVINSRADVKTQSFSFLILFIISKRISQFMFIIVLSTFFSENILLINL